ncbi:hypothetical protein [Gorillibacterium sp. sgz500922]|uniref:hypothetical protein n=1 Tax=Gorillibacterium sp. sgz500922 TaxID=3446694 RepID=UPI003F67B721
MENSSHIGTKLKKLQEFYVLLSITPFPEAPENDDVYDAYSELVEYDGHVAGLASSALRGNRIDKHLVFKNHKLDAFIEEIEADNESEVKSIKNYKNLLDSIVTILQEF